MANFPSQWITDVVILEGMFLVQTPPIPTMSCMRDYVNLLLAKSVRPHLKAGDTAVHVVFDNPGSLPEEIEHRRQDNTTEESSAHQCIHFSSEQPIPGTWRAVLLCQACKRALTHYLADDMLQVVPSSLHGTQSFTTNVGCTALTVSTNALVYPEPILRSNADEADLRVWLHCANSQGRRKLIFSPDTDVYHLVAQLIPQSEILLQLS